MKILLNTLIIAFVLSTSAFSQTNSVTNEIKALILEDQRIANESNEQILNYSEQGALEFWSSGGLLHTMTNDLQVNRFDDISLQAKHIEVISIANGEAAVAMFYNEGSMKPVNGVAVSHYLTRITQVFVKENDKWVVVASHYSPVTGGSGTSQSSVEN
tara:strand:- start:106 stop:579 length:474 start_codon:yes stop_codon:yes gene_type:complete